jgi:hypothetical protein
MTAGLKDEATALAPITGADISEYLASVDDFAFEREIYSVARGLGFQTQHSALYADPVT